jgi:hypothetical protein
MRSAPRMAWNGDSRWGLRLRPVELRKSFVSELRVLMNVARAAVGDLRAG